MENFNDSPERQQTGRGVSDNRGLTPWSAGPPECRANEYTADKLSAD